MDVSLIGTGLMGVPMGMRLLEVGHSVTVYNRTGEKTEPLVNQGARLAADPSQAISASRNAVLMLRDFPAIRSVLDNASMQSLDGRTMIQMSTIAPAESEELSRDVVRAGGRYLEAPVLGSIPQARSGQLILMVGGDPALHDDCAELLRCFGPEPIHIGEVGQAAAMKLALNQMIASQIATFAMGLGMIRRRGIDCDQFMEILRRSALFAPMFDAKLTRLMRRDFSNPNFPTDLLLKDLDLALGEAEAQGLRAAALQGVRSIVEEAVREHCGGDDYSAVYSVIDPNSD